MYLGAFQVSYADYCNSGDTCRVLKGSDLHTTGRALPHSHMSILARTWLPLTFKLFDLVTSFYVGEHEMPGKWQMPLS